MSTHGQHGSHGAHAPQGGDGLGQGFGQPGHGHNFLSHLLGLDHDAHHGGHVGGHPQHGHGVAGGAPVQHLPSQSAGWSSALQAVKLSDALQGINVTPNFLFILLFAGFIGWLFVIYWVRHHEPLANSVLGTSVASSPTAAADRRLIAGTKIAFPTRTCAEMGDIYVPTPQAPAAANAAAAATLPANTSSFGTAMSLPPAPVPIPAPAPDPQPTPLSFAAAPATTGTGLYPAPVYAPPAAVGSAFLVPEPQPAGARVKMIVNR